MFRKMRRSRQELKRKESIAVLERNASGVLGLAAAFALFVAIDNNSN